MIQSPEALEKADACLYCHLHSPVIIAVGYDPKEAWHREHDNKDHGEIDATIAATQMMLQAADLGLAPPMWACLILRSCWRPSRKWRV